MARFTLPRLPRFSVTRKGLRQFTVVAFILIALIALYRYLPLQTWLQSGASVYRGLGVLGVVLFMVTYAVLVILFAPVPTLNITAGALYGLQYGYLVGAGSSLLAAAICFLIARVLLRSKARNWVSKYPAFRAIERAGGAQPIRTLLSVHANPLFPFPIGNYMLSLAPIRFVLYILGAWAGMLPGTLFYVYVGTLGDKVALDGSHLAPLDLWLLGAGRVALWGVGLWGIVSLGLLLKRYSRQAPPLP